LSEVRFNYVEPFPPLTMLHSTRGNTPRSSAEDERNLNY
jgi:hypothetical protein